MTTPDFDLDAVHAALHSGASRRLVLRHLAGGLTAVAVLAGTGSRGLAQEASPVASPVAADPFRFRVGAFEVTAVSDGGIAFPNDLFPAPISQILFVDAPPDELEGALRAAGLDDWVDTPETAAGTVAITPLVVDTGDHLVLIDTGVGPATPFPGTGQLLTSLAAAGIDPAAIDTVFLTHAHADHVLGAVDAAGAAAFPNARYAMAKSEHAFWTDDARLAQVFPSLEMAAEAGGAFRAVLPAIEAQLELVDEAVETEIVPGLRAVAAYGHTPGHAAVIVASGGEQLLVTGDVLIHPLHVTYPDWNFVLDTLPSQTDATRRGLLDRAADAGMLVQVYHVGYPGLGRVVPDGDLLRWEPAT